MEIMKKNVVSAKDLPQIWACVTNINKKQKNNATSWILGSCKTKC
jgi:hypothetical protein